MAKPPLFHLKKHLHIFRCPSCLKDDLLVNQRKSGVVCKDCGQFFPVSDGIPQFFLPNDWDQDKRRDVTAAVKAFYEETPFPNYEKLETAGDLIAKAERGIFAHMLNEQVPFNTRILEVGCGTGQLTNFLGIPHRFVFGTDMCLNSLRLANGFKVKNSLERVGFYQMNLFRPVFKEESFHLVICNGVLHHTSDPLAGFQSIARLVKKGGFILIGLYNRLGRLITDSRRILFRISHDRWLFLDRRLRAQEVGQVRKLTWFRDQYQHPHESKHTIGEVLGWFKENGFEFYSGIPSPTLSDRFNRDFELFRKHPAGRWPSHLLSQLELMFRGGKEGGFFIMIGRRIN